MRLEFEPNSSALPFVENEVVSQAASSEVERMLREGVRAAQEGKRAEARSLLLRVTEADADSENAWLWLASISEYPEELLVFLNNVLRINPNNERALEWHKATKSLLAKTLVQRGVDASNENRREFARQCFEQALEHEAENEMAWLWMASVADSEDEKAAYFERVLNVNSENETALNSLKAIQSQKTQRLFQAALTAAFDGRHGDAQEILEDVLSRESEMEDAWILKAHLANSFEDRAECFLKLRVLNPENEMANASLASWRRLADKREEQPAAAEEAPEFAAEARAEAPVEEVSVEEPVAEISNEDFSNEEFAAASLTGAEAARAEEFAAENETENQASGFSEAETAYLDQPADLAAEQPDYEEFAPADAPTQELSFGPSFALQEFQSVEAAEESRVAETREQENSYEEFHAEEVQFEPEENQEAAPELSEPSDYLKAQLEAEEAEMHWAFKNSQENKEPEDYFNNFDEADDDIHKTQQANYDTEDFPQDFAAEEQPAEDFADPNTEALNESTDEWRDTSPGVFVNYSPVAVEENEAPVAEMPAEADFSEQFADAAVEEQVSMTAEEPAMPPAEEKSAPAKAETVLCPFCDAVNEKQAFSCGSCQTVLTLSDLEMLLGQQVANSEKLQQSVESLERENESYGLNAEQLKNLGVGHLNLKNYRQGFLYLQDAVRMNPSNVLLDAQVNALAIRLSEMEEQQNAHDAMPKNRKILVVDDSPTVRKLISGKLEKCGHEVVCAVDGVDALEKINELKPDLVLLDITMPRMDGYQVCKLIRNNETTKDVPVVMISGKDGFFDKVRGRMAGTSGYITKPFGPETLMKTVETYLN